MTTAFDQIRIGTCQISNRIGLGPLNSGLLGPKGECSLAGLEFYEQYFQDGVGVVFIGGIAVSAEGRSNHNSLFLDQDEKCFGIKAIVEKAHQYQSKIAIQLMHAGRQTNPDEIGEKIVAPSAIPCPVVKKMPEELTTKDISRIVKQFGNAAKIAENCGVDLLELHGAHGYLIGGFLSPYSNKRNDTYGGSLKNRFRFLNEILSEIKSKTKLPIGVRFSCIENADGGQNFEDLVSGIKEYAESYIDFISISAGVYSSNDIIIPKRSLGQALWKDYSSNLKQKVSVPIMLIGNIISIDMANKILEEEAADIILMARALLADPKLILKTVSGNAAKIQKCTDCKLCKYHSKGKEFIYCPFNDVLLRLHKKESRNAKRI